MRGGWHAFAGVELGAPTPDHPRESMARLRKAAALPAVISVSFKTLRRRPKGGVLSPGALCGVRGCARIPGKLAAGDCPCQLPQRFAKITKFSPQAAVHKM